MITTLLSFWPFLTDGIFGDAVRGTTRRGKVAGGQIAQVEPSFGQRRRI